MVSAAFFVNDVSRKMASSGLALLLVEGSDAHHSRHGSFCPCAVGRMPPVQQIDALTTDAEPD